MLRPPPMRNATSHSPMSAAVSGAPAQAHATHFDDRTNGLDIELACARREPEVVSLVLMWPSGGPHPLPHVEPHTAGQLRACPHVRCVTSMPSDTLSSWAVSGNRLRN